MAREKVRDRARRQQPRWRRRFPSASYPKSIGKGLSDQPICFVVAERVVPRSSPFEFEAMFPCSVPIATDGEGSFWVVDVGSGGAWREVFFIAHDPPVAILQARDVASFLGQVFDAHGAPALKGDVVTRIWKENPYVVSRTQALASPDPAVRAFAEQVNDNFAIVDVRDSERGKGFVWGAAGPNTEVHRAGEDLLFAIEQKKRGLLARLFST